MKQLSTHFIIGNIITAVLLVVFASEWESWYKEISVKGSNPVYGYFIYFVVITGIIANAYKAHDLAHHSINKLNWTERIFLILLYLLSMIGMLILLGIGLDLIHEMDGRHDRSYMILMILIMVAGFILLVLESFFLEHPPKKPLSGIKLLFANIGSMLYSSLGISICWNSLVIGGGIQLSDGFIGVVQTLFLMLPLVFSFQRLFWYEVMSNTNSRPDHWKTASAILLVILSGTAPLWFR